MQTRAWKECPVDFYSSLRDFEKKMMGCECTVPSSLLQNLKLINYFLYISTSEHTCTTCQSWSTTTSSLLRFHSSSDRVVAPSLFSERKISRTLFFLASPPRHKNAKLKILKSSLLRSHSLLYFFRQSFPFFSTLFFFHSPCPGSSAMTPSFKRW